jgi:regulator of replication initiation timing
VRKYALNFILFGIIFLLIVVVLIQMLRLHAQISDLHERLGKSSKETPSSNKIASLEKELSALKKRLEKIEQTPPVVVEKRVETPVSEDIKKEQPRPVSAKTTPVKEELTKKEHPEPVDPPFVKNLISKGFQPQSARKIGSQVRHWQVIFDQFERERKQGKDISQKVKELQMQVQRICSETLSKHEIEIFRKLYPHLYGKKRKEIEVGRIPEEEKTPIHTPK